MYSNVVCMLYFSLNCATKCANGCGLTDVCHGLCGFDCSGCVSELLRQDSHRKGSKSLIMKR